MYFLFILLLTQIYCQNYVETLVSACRCSQISSKQDCEKLCKWDDQAKDGQNCIDKSCSDSKTLEDCNSNSQCIFLNNLCQVYESCDQLSDEGSCTARDNCYYVNNVCQTFSECQQFTSGDECAYMDESCQFIDEFCRPKVICYFIKSKDQCNYQIETISGKYCIWQEEASSLRLLQGTAAQCLGFKFEACTDINKDNISTEDKKALCNLKPTQCVYYDENADENPNSCQQRECFNFLTESECSKNWNSVIDDTGAVYLCRWDSETDECSTGFDIDTLTADNCYDESLLYALTYNSTEGKCIQCPGYQIQLMINFILYMLI